MLILAFDTSCKSAAVALLDDDVILYDAIINVGLNHSEILLPAINDACRQSKVKIDDIDLFACTLGPGSFTGLRIGISTLKGLLLATGKPAAGVSSLAALAMNVNESESMVCPVIDAGRGQVYTACYSYNCDGSLKQISEEKVGDPHETLMDSDQDIILVGDGAMKYQTLLEKNMKRARTASSRQQHIKASTVGILGHRKYDCNELLDPPTFIPFYLRSADARKAKGLFRD
jgi:tRNA threonylcarbamoyladenosine biosynthesis protein TsaB